MVAFYNNLCYLTGSLWCDHDMFLLYVSMMEKWGWGRETTVQDVKSTLRSSGLSFLCRNFNRTSHLIHTRKCRHFQGGNRSVSNTCPMPTLHRHSQTYILCIVATIWQQEAFNKSITNLEKHEKDPHLNGNLSYPHLCP